MGDNVCALYDRPDHNLRLYCIKYGLDIVILGGGGCKPKHIRALQEDVKLNEENQWMRLVSEKIYHRQLSREIRFSTDGLDFIGDLIFDDEL